MIRPLLTLALVAAPLAIAGCDAKTLSAVGSAIAESSNKGPKAKVTGYVYAPATQVAVVAAGGMNWRIASRSDEKGVPSARVSFSGLGSVASGTTQTTSTGSYTVEVPAGDYTVTASFKAKDGSNVTLTGLVKVADSGASFQLDAAHNLVASKLVSLGVSTLDAAKLSQAYSQMDMDLSKVSSVPTPTSQSAAAAEFDKVASADLKALVAGMAK